MKKLIGHLHLLTMRRKVDQTVDIGQIFKSTISVSMQLCGISRAAGAMIEILELVWLVNNAGLPSLHSSMTSVHVDIFVAVHALGTSGYDLGTVTVIS